MAWCIGVGFKKLTKWRDDAAENGRSGQTRRQRRRIDRMADRSKQLQQSTPTARSSAAVSNSGRPMIPEWLPSMRSIQAAAAPWIA